jgi:hypothetical protein
MWQERCIALVKELEEDGDVLHLDSLAGLLTVQPDGAAIADFLEPAMASGDVRVLGTEVALLDDSTIDVSGSQGGGSVLAGGGRQGRDASVPNARALYMGAATAAASCCGRTRRRGSTAA